MVMVIIIVTVLFIATIIVTYTVIVIPVVTVTRSHSHSHTVNVTNLHSTCLTEQGEVHLRKNPQMTYRVDCQRYFHFLCLEAAGQYILNKKVTTYMYMLIILQERLSTKYLDKSHLHRGHKIQPSMHKLPSMFSVLFE